MLQGEEGPDGVGRVKGTDMERISEGWHLLVHGGVVLPTNPGPVSAFLRAASPGAYTTTRTTGGASHLLLWDRHLARLCESMQLLVPAFPHLYQFQRWDLDVGPLVQLSVKVGLAAGLEMRRAQEEIKLTVLICGDKGSQSEPTGHTSGGDVYLHASNYNGVAEGKMPVAINVAVMGPGRTLARAKFSRWASTREALEKVMPANISEIILSNNGDALLEGTLTNFFVVTRMYHNVLNDNKDPTSTVRPHHSSSSGWTGFEVQTAPLEDGVLPGIIRSLVIEVCRDAGIPLREVAPSWSSCHTWEEAFVTSGIRILQPVAKIQMPSSWTSGFSVETLRGTSWQQVELTVCGLITQEIHKLVTERALQESISIAEIIGR